MGSNELRRKKNTFHGLMQQQVLYLDEKGRVYQKTSSCTDTAGVVLPQVRTKMGVPYCRGQTQHNLWTKNLQEGQHRNLQPFLRANYLFHGQFLNKAISFGVQNTCECIGDVLECTAGFVVQGCSYLARQEPKKPAAAFLQRPQDRL